MLEIVRVVGILVAVGDVVGRSFRADARLVDAHGCVGIFVPFRKTGDDVFLVIFDDTIALQGETWIVIIQLGAHM